MADQNLNNTDLSVVIKASAAARAAVAKQIDGAVRRAEAILNDYSVSTRVKDEMRAHHAELVTLQKTFAAMGGVTLPAAATPEVTGSLDIDHGAEIPWQNPAAAPSMFQASAPKEPAPNIDGGTTPTSPTLPANSIVGKGGSQPKTWDDAAAAHEWRNGFGLKGRLARNRV